MVAPATKNCGDKPWVLETKNYEIELYDIDKMEKIKCIGKLQPFDPVKRFRENSNIGLIVIKPADFEWGELDNPSEIKSMCICKPQGQNSNQYLDFVNEFVGNEKWAIDSLYREDMVVLVNKRLN
jgi:hypothetical protein